MRGFAERNAINAPIQGSEADIIKLAMVRIWQRFKAEGIRSKMILQVHDELILEAPECEVELVQALLKQEMEHVVDLAVPLRVSIEAGSCWGDFH